MILLRFNGVPLLRNLPFSPLKLRIGWIGEITTGVFTDEMIFAERRGMSGEVYRACNHSGNRRFESCYPINAPQTFIIN